MTFPMAVILALAIVSPIHSQCQDGYFVEFEGCTLEKNEIYEWSDSPVPATCRQKLEARLFYSHLSYLQAKSETARNDIDSILGNVERVQFYIDVMQTVLSAFSVTQGIIDLNDPGIDHADIQLLLKEGGAVTQFMSDFFDIPPDIAATMVETAIDFAGVIIQISAKGAFAKVVAKGALAKIIIPAELALALSDLVPEIVGSISLEHVAAELNSHLIGWWYLEDFYRLGGTFDGSGTDAHGQVAQEYGLPASSDVYSVISKIAEEKDFVSKSFHSWFFGEQPYDLHRSVEFAEHIKARVSFQLDNKLELYPFRLAFNAGSLSNGTKPGTSGKLRVSVHNLQTDTLDFCLTARHGTISGDFESGFLYRAPEGIIDEGDPYASTEEITVTVNNGVEQLQDTESFRLRNEQIFVIIKWDYTEPGSPTDYDVGFRLVGESEWRELSELNRRHVLPGTHTIEFRPIPGISTPPPQSFTAPNLGTSDYAYVYVEFEPVVATPPRGAVRVNLNRSEGRWRIRGESSWRVSGNVVTDLAFGAYDIEFLTISGWVRPPMLQAIVDQEPTLALTAEYQAVPAAKGSLELTLAGTTDFLRFPDHAFWRVEGDDLWRPRGYRYEQLPVGSAMVEFRRFFGWLKPATQSVSIAAGVNQVTVEYLKDPGVEFPVGGWVKNNSVGVEGVTVSGFPDGPATTNRYGRYKKKVPDGWTGTLTASKAGLSFEPASIAVEVHGTYDMNNSFRVSDTPPVPDRTAPVVKVLAPQRNQAAQAGEVFTIRWSAEDDSGLLADTKVQYRSVTTNQVWTTLAENLEETLEYDWTIPDQKSTRAEVRVVAEDFSGNEGQATSAPFEISGGGLCRSPVTAPRLKPWVSTPHDYYVIDWLDVRNAESYVLQEDTHPSFSSAQELTTAESFRYFRGRARDTYYYRVKAVGSCGSSPWSAFEDYEVLANRNPILPASPIPANGTRDVPLTLLLVEWDSEDPDGDRLEHDVYFGRSEPLSRICSRTASHACNVPGPLLPGSTYFWKVVAVDDLGARTAGAVWTLTTEAVFADLGIVELTVDNASPPFEGIVTATAEIANRGNEAADDTFLFFYIESPDGEASYQVKKVFVPALTVGDSTTIETLLTLPPNFVGPHVLVAQVNKYNSIREQNRADNEARINLTITDSEAPTVTVREPVPERRYRTGFEMDIRWSYDDNEGVDRHDVHYSADGGPWEVIIVGDEMGYVDWLIPDHLEDAQVRIKVTVWDHSGNSTEAISESVLITTGVAPEVTVLYPTGGEQLLSETPYELRWEASSPVGIQDIDLEIWQNGFKTQTIAWDVPNTGAYTWTPPNYLINQDYHFVVEAEGNNAVETLAFSPGTFRVVDSFQVPLPWHTPHEIFTMPAPPPIPPDAYNYGQPPVWNQWMWEPRITIDAGGTVHCLVFYGESIRMREPGANWTYHIGNEGVLYRSYAAGSFGPQSKEILVTYDESTGAAEDLLSGPWIADSVGNLHLTFVIRSLIPYFDGSSPDEVNREIHHTYLAGAAWASAANISQTAGARSDSPAMAVTSDGAVHVAWREKISGHSQIYYRVRNPAGGAWSSPEVVLDYSFLPALLSDASDGLILTAQQFSPFSEVVLARHDGLTWSEPESLWVGSTGGHAPRMSLSPDGDSYVHLSQGTDVFVWKVTPEDRRDWIYQFPDAQFYTETAIFFDGAGSPHLGYQHFQSVPRNVFVERRIYEDGSFGPMSFIDSTAGEAKDVDMVFTPAGEVYAIWHESLTGSFEPMLLNYAMFTDDIEPPTVTVLEPAAAQELTGGTVFDITWNASDNVGVTSVDLRMSTDDGETYEDIALTQPDSGSFAWNVPLEEMAAVLVAVEARDANGNVGIGLSQTFLVTLPASGVTVLAPNGSEQLPSGETVTISWEGSPGAAFDVQVSLDDGLLWSDVATGLVGVTSHPWQVPAANTSRARVRVIADLGDGELSSDASDGPFSIQEQAGPFEPYDPYPPVNAGHVGAGESLTWSGGHPDSAATVTYEVTFGSQIDSLTPLCVAAATSCPLPAGLDENEQYYWRVTADDGVVSASGSIWTFHTGDPSGLLPPQQLVAGQNADGAVVLEWSDQNAEPGIEHRVEKQWPGTDTFQTIAQQGGEALTFEDSAVEGSQEYVYRIRAVRVNKGKTLQTSTASNEEHIATDNQLPYPPAAPDPPSGEEVPTLQPTLSWSGGDPDVDDTVTYGLELWTAETGEESVRVRHPDLVHASWPQLSPLRDNTLYSWQVRARDSHGGEALGPIWAFETPAEVPATPTDLAVFQAEDRVVVAWRADLQAGEGFFVERRLTSTSRFELIEHWTPLETAALPGYFAVDEEVSRLVAEIVSDAVTYRVGAYNEEGYYSYSEPVDLVVTPTLPEMFSLLTTRDGTGQGMVSSEPEGIDCGNDCAEEYAQDTVVTLTANPEAGSTFAGWEGDCSGTGACMLTMDADVTVTAVFQLIVLNESLTVVLEGSGSGAVTSQPAGISCGVDCTAEFPRSTEVTLTVSAAEGSEFTGWSGGVCSGTGGSCTVTVEGSTQVTATFELTVHTITVNKSGDGDGTVTSEPPVIDCGGVCSADLAFGTEIMFLATPAIGSSFGGWEGIICNGSVGCTFIVTGPVTTTARFAAACIDDTEAQSLSWRAACGPADAGTTSRWSIVASDSASPSHAWHVSGEDPIKDQVLELVRAVPVTSGAAFSFEHRFDTETGFDGGVLEYSVNSGLDWYDILKGDGNSVPFNTSRFVTGGYTVTLSDCCGNPLATRAAWSGDNDGWQKTTVDLSDFSGHEVLIRFRMGTDSRLGAPGWWIDDLAFRSSNCPLGLIFHDGFESGDPSAWASF